MNGSVFFDERSRTVTPSSDCAVKAIRRPLARAAGGGPAFWTASIHSSRGAAGVSLVECLIATALTLTLLSILTATSADILSAVNSAADRADQYLRLRQISRFLDRAMSLAGLPSSWNQELPHEVGDVFTELTLSDPCVTPESAGYRSEWGGVALVEADSDCFPGSGHHTGLYIETVHPCPEGCGAGEGYALFPATCETSNGSGAGAPAWRAQWQSDLYQLEGCAKAVRWGVLQRMLLVYRKTGGEPDSSSALRVQTPVAGREYRWGSAEVLMDGVTGWTMSRITLPPPTVPPEELPTESDSHWLPRHLTSSAVRLEMSIASEAATPGTSVSASKLLIGSALRQLYAL